MPDYFGRRYLLLVFFRVKMAETSGVFKFRKHATVGNASAEDDAAFLVDCFMDTGDLAVLSDCSDARRVVVGRTGAGKSALLFQLSRCHSRVIHISPESLSLNHLANSGVIRFCTEVGINLEVFYKMLWRHVFTVEVLKERYGIVNEQAKSSFLERLFGVGQRDTKKALAIEYLEKFSDKFWQETEYRIGEIRKTVESDLTTGIKASVPNVKFEVGGAKKLSEEEKVEVIHRGQEIVQAMQVRQLNDVLDVLRDDLLGEMQTRYYVLIDRLDENWVDDSIRYRLIRALIDSAREFRRVNQVKVIVSIRTDLLESVFDRTRDAGFQEEKYRAICFPLAWTTESLEQMLEKRINKLIKDAYTTAPVTLADILPEDYVGQSALQYMIERTLKRPRDLIEFFNICLRQAEGSPKITWPMLEQAEHEYSRSRLIAVGDEWSGEYPGLIGFATKFLHARHHSFSLQDISDELVSTACLDFCISGKTNRGNVLGLAQQCAEDRITAETFRIELAHLLYKVGIVGIKAEGFQKVSWAEASVFSVSPPELRPESKISIHPTFWRALGTIPPIEK